MSPAPAATTRPPVAPPMRIGDLVETPTDAAILIDVDPAGQHQWVILDHPDPDRIGRHIRRPASPDDRVVGRDPQVALAARAQRVRRCATCSAPTDRHWCSETCRREDEGDD